MKFTSIAAAAALLLAATQASAATTITFDELANNTSLSNQYAALGVSFSPNAFTGAGSSTSLMPWATNTNMLVVDIALGDVGALGGPSLVSSNLLHGFNAWLDEDGDPSFRVSFATPINAFSADFAGIAGGTDVRLFAYNGDTLLATVAGPACTPNCQFTLSYAAASITSVVVAPGSFADWVGVDNIVFQPVPEAGTWVMMVLGLGVLVLRRRQPRLVSK